jgi:hypothetical protein
MSDATSLLFDLPGFRVVSCTLTPLGVRRLVVMQQADEHACPRCGVLVGGKPYDLRESRVKDLPFGHRPLEVISYGSADSPPTRLTPASPCSR